MDVIDLDRVLVPTTEPELDEAMRAGARPIAGGTWFFSERRQGSPVAVDLTRMGWPVLERTGDGIRLAATATMRELQLLPVAGMPAARIFAAVVERLLGGWKIHRVATVGGNIALGLPAGPMTSLFAGLDADAVIQGPGGAERRMPVGDFVGGALRPALDPGELLRAISVPAATLAGRAGFRRGVLIPKGRSGVFAVAHLDTRGRYVHAVTAATPHPHVLRFDAVPDAATLRAAIDDAVGDDWLDDPHGAPDWRRAMSLRFAESIRRQLESGGDPDPAEATNGWW